MKAALFRTDLRSADKPRPDYHRFRQNRIRQCRLCVIHMIRIILFCTAPIIGCSRLRLPVPPKVSGTGSYESALFLSTAYDKHHTSDMYSNGFPAAFGALDFLDVNASTISVTTNGSILYILALIPRFARA